MSHITPHFGWGEVAYHKAGTFTPPGTSQGKSQSTIRGPFDISGYYAGDMVFFRWSYDNDGASNSDIEVMAIEVKGVQWSLGEHI